MTQSLAINSPNLELSTFPARYQLVGSNIVLQTWYNLNGGNNVNLTAQGSARAVGQNNPPVDQKQMFQGGATLPLDFENDTFLAFQSDNCQDDVGTNAMLFFVDQATHITASITNPATGQQVASYAGDVPSATYVEIDWDFTQADGVTPAEPWSLINMRTQINWTVRGRL